MKKTLLTAVMAGALLLMPQEADGQAFLKKLKDKAEDAVKDAIGNTFNNAADESAERAQKKANERIDSEIDNIIPQGARSNGNGVVKSNDLVKHSQTSRLNWDDPVSPSKASQPEALLNALPGLPSAAQLANPTEDNQISFYRAIKAVTLRAEELNKQNTCTEADEEAFNKKHTDRISKMYKELYGLTDEEFKILTGESGTEADRERVAEKIVQSKIMGKMPNQGAMAELERHAAQMESMGEEAYVAQQTAKMKAATQKVARKHEAELKKYSGITANELVATMDAKNQKEMEAKSDALNKRVKAFRKTLSAADQKKAEELDKQIGAEVQQAVMTAMDMSELGKYGEQAQAENEREKSITAEYNAFIEKERKYINDMMNFVVEFNENDYKIQNASKANYLKIETLKKSIYSGVGNADKLFAQAEELIAKSRENVAQEWINHLQKKLDQIKSNMPKLVALNKQAVNDDILPECATMREPYNQIIEAGNILLAAYQDFPTDYPAMYNSEVAETITIAEGEHFIWPEIVSKTNGNYSESLGLFKTDGKNVYKYAGKSKWTKMPANYRPDTYKASDSPKDETFTSKDGKRTVTYSAKGRYIILPEGDVIQPMCIEKTADEVVWYMLEQTDTNSITINKCTYKL